MQSPVHGVDSPLHQDRLGTPGWESALLEKDPGLLVDSQLGTSHWHSWRLSAFQSTNKTWTDWFGSSRGHQDGWGLEHMKSGRGDEMAVGGHHSSLPTPGEVTEKTVAINWKGELLTGYKQNIFQSEENWMFSRLHRDAVKCRSLVAFRTWLDKSPEQSGQALNKRLD